MGRWESWGRGLLLLGLGRGLGRGWVDVVCGMEAEDISPTIIIAGML